MSKRQNLYTPPSYQKKIGNEFIYDNESECNIKNIYNIK